MKAEIHTLIGAMILSFWAAPIYGADCQKPSKGLPPILEEPELLEAMERLTERCNDELDKEKPKLPSALASLQAKFKASGATPLTRHSCLMALMEAHLKEGKKP